MSRDQTEFIFLGIPIKLTERKGHYLFDRVLICPPDAVAAANAKLL